MSRLVALAVLLLVMSGSPVTAQTAQDKAPMEEQLSEAEKQLEMAVQLMLQALRGIIGSIPQYHMPEVLENGDIIIRRVQPDEVPAPEEKTDEPGKAEESMKL